MLDINEEEEFTQGGGEASSSSHFRYPPNTTYSSSSLFIPQSVSVRESMFCVTGLTLCADSIYFSSTGQTVDYTNDLIIPNFESINTSPLSKSLVNSSSLDSSPFLGNSSNYSNCWSPQLRLGDHPKDSASLPPSSLSDTPSYTPSSPSALHFDTSVFFYRFGGQRPLYELYGDSSPPISVEWHPHHNSLLVASRLSVGVVNIKEEEH